MGRQSSRRRWACLLACALLAIIGLADTRPRPHQPVSLSGQPCDSHDQHRPAPTTVTSKPPRADGPQLLAILTDSLTQAPPAVPWPTPGAELAVRSIPAGHIKPRPA